MNESKQKELIFQLSEHLKKETWQFLIKNFEENTDISNLLNIILSGHISSIINLMSLSAKGNEEAEVKVKKFLSELNNFLSERFQTEDIS